MERIHSFFSLLFLSIISVNFGNHTNLTTRPKRADQHIHLTSPFLDVNGLSCMELEEWRSTDFNI